MENTPQGEFGENKSRIKTKGKIKPKIKIYGHFSALLGSFLPRLHARHRRWTIGGRHPPRMLRDRASLRISPSYTNVWSKTVLFGPRATLRCRLRHRPPIKSKGHIFPIWTRFSSSFFSWLQNHMENTPHGEFGENKSRIKT